MPAISIALIHDHLAGHTRQCEAIVEAIADVRPVSVTRLAVGPWSPLRSHFTRRLALSVPGVEALAPLTVRGDWRRPFDLIVSASGATISGSVLLKRRNNARNIYSGWARGIAPGDIDCILVQQPEQVTTPHHVFGPLPVLRFRPTEKRRPLVRLSGSCVGVILGGEARGAGFDFVDDYAHTLFERLKSVDAAVPDISWVVVTSRRTPNSNYAAIEAFAAAVGRCDFVDARSAGVGSISRVYGADAVLVTEDSRTMVTEFIRNGYPLAVLAVPRNGRRRPLRHSEAWKAVGEPPPLDPAAIDPVSLEATLSAVTVTQEDIYAETRALIGHLLPEMVSPHLS